MERARSIVRLRFVGDAARIEHAHRVGLFHASQRSRARGAALRRADVYHLVMSDVDAARVERVRAALAAHGHDSQILDTGDSTHTAQLAAMAAGCALGQIVKTLVVHVAGEPMFVLVPGDRRLDDRMLAARFAVGRKQVKLAEADQVLELTGYPIGGVSPFGTPAALPALIDASFERFDVLWVAAGTASAILPIRRDDLMRYVHAEYAKIST
jgi:Cys-tRNA(Pro) deacylase